MKMQFDEDMIREDDNLDTYDFGADADAYEYAVGNMDIDLGQDAFMSDIFG